MSKYYYKDLFNIFGIRFFYFFSFLFFLFCKYLDIGMSYGFNFVKCMKNTQERITWKYEWIKGSIDLNFISSSLIELEWVVIDPTLVAHWCSAPVKWNATLAVFISLYSVHAVDWNWFNCMLQFLKQAVCDLITLPCNYDLILAIWKNVYVCLFTYIFEKEMVGALYRVFVWLLFYKDVFYTRARAHNVGINSYGCIYRLLFFRRHAIGTRQGAREVGHGQQSILTRREHRTLFLEERSIKFLVALSIQYRIQHCYPVNIFFSIILAGRGAGEALHHCLTVT